jgi:hypothetical protein
LAGGYKTSANHCGFSLARGAEEVYRVFHDIVINKNTILVSVIEEQVEADN